MPATNAQASGLAQRYAKALFELAQEGKALDAVLADLDRLDAAIDESDDLATLIKNPVLSREEQEQGILAVAERMGVGELTRRFLGVLAQKRRLYALPDVAKSFRAMLAESRGEVTAEVVSAQPLTDEQQGALKGSIERYVGRNVSMQTRVDGGLLGGLVVQVGSRMLDASLKTKLQQLEQSMRGMG
ncbi:MAG: F0F1 ATP synthase subunit delta [Geminicoccaceae bacterium]|nr:F0F1 ATP synthase subunit delta [Geminicoccaceae bacterium]